MRVNDEFKLTFMPKFEGKYPLIIIHLNIHKNVSHVTLEN